MADDGRRNSENSEDDAELGAAAAKAASSSSQYGADAPYAPLPASPKTGSDTSIAIFRRHMKRERNETTGVVTIDATDVIGPECFREWLQMRSRSHKVAEPEKTFQRTITCYLSATDGRLPFTPEEEAAILKVVRVKQVWCVVSRCWARRNTSLVRSSLLVNPQACVCRHELHNWKERIPSAGACFIYSARRSEPP